jgi:hypothetical protein
MRLISPTYIPSDHTLNIWRSGVDRGALGRGKRWDSSLWTHDIVNLRREVPDGHAVFVRNVDIHSGARRWSWAPGSTIRVVRDDNLEHPAHEQECVARRRSTASSLGASRTQRSCFKRCQATNYDRSGRWSDTTTDQNFIDDYSIIRIYDDKIWLLFIKLYSTSAYTSAQSDRRGEAVGQIEAHALEPVCVEWSTNNMPPTQKKLIQAQSAGHE